MSALIAGRYEPLEVLGVGARGRVLRAWDHRHQLQVVLEELPAGAPAQLDLEPHPHLPLVRDDFFEGPQHYVLVDWVDGPTLADVLLERGAPGMPLTDVVRWVKHAAEALDHLHGRRPPVVHGHVQPANMVLTSTGRVVLVDREMSGAPGYLAPEVAAGGPPTPAADVYSLAATATALLTGSVPAASGPRRLGGSTDTRALGELVLRRGLSRDPARRPRSARDLAAALSEGASAAPGPPGVAQPLVGRDPDLAAATPLLNTTRVLTLTGPPGVGKSRLAAELAARAGRFTVVVRLSEHPPPTAVDTAVALAVGVTAEPGRSAADALATRLAGRRTLLVLDDADYHVEGIAGLLAFLLRACKDLHVLATSREPLRLSGEVTYAVPPLSESSAARLFEDRAGVSAPELTRRLDGLPLAVELAAANVSGPPMVDSSLHLDEREATPPDHHQSLRVAFDWSYDRLSGRERAVFRALATLEQAFSLDEAEQHCASVGIPVEEVLESLVALVDKSLVVAEERKGQLSYRLLPLLGEYGRSCGGENTGSFLKDQGQPRRPRHEDLAVNGEPPLKVALREDWTRRSGDGSSNETD